MKKITIWLMQHYLKKAIESAQKETNTTVKTAKNHRVESYKSAIIFLNL